MDSTIVFIDSGFLSKLSRYYGKGKYLTYDIIKFSENLANKNNFTCKKIFYYTAPPFQSNNPTIEESSRKYNYDSFIKKLSKNPKVIIREGRCQKLNDSKGYSKYSQKAVDTLMVMDIMLLPVEHKEVKEILLIVCDSDFVPVIEKLKEHQVKTILYTYFTKRRDTNFSRSFHLMKTVFKYIKLSISDFENSPLDNKKLDK